MALGTAIFNRLNANAAIKKAVNGTIVPEWRNDLVPAVVYELAVDDVDHSYEGLSVRFQELTISVVTDKYAKSVELAELVVGAFDNAAWTDGGFSVLGCFLRTMDEESVSRADEDDRLSVVNIRFDLVVKATA